MIYLPSDILSSKDRKTLYDLQNNLLSRDNLEGVLYNRDISPTRDGSEATNGSCRLMPSFAYAELATAEGKLERNVNRQLGVYVLAKVNLSRYGYPSIISDKGQWKLFPFFQSTCLINLMGAARDLSVIFRAENGTSRQDDLLTFLARSSTRQSGSHHVSLINR